MRRIFAARGILVALAWAALAIVAGVTFNGGPPLVRPPIAQGPHR
jgi:hypothetical protein